VCQYFSGLPGGGEPFYDALFDNAIGADAGLAADRELLPNRRPFVFDLEPASTLNVAARVYGSDAKGEFVYGVCEVADGAGAASDPVIKRLYAEPTAASLALKDQLLAKIPEETIRGFAAMSAAMGFIAAQHKQIKRTGAPQIGYSMLFRVFCGAAIQPPLQSRPTTLPSRSLLKNSPVCLGGWISELSGVGSAERNVVMPQVRPNKGTLNIDGELKVIRPNTVFRGTVPESGAQFMLIVQPPDRRVPLARDSLGLVYLEKDEAAVLTLVTQLLAESNPFKNRVVLINRDLRTVRSRMSERTWNDIIPHEQVRAELDFMAASIREREMLKSEGLNIRRGLLLSGPPENQPLSNASSTTLRAKHR
jgi:hypothetical protein